MRDSLRRFFIRAALAIIGISSFFVVTQDFQMFPGLIPQLLGRKDKDPPQEVEVLTTLTSDGEEVMLWRVEPTITKRKEVALMFHGNAETLRSSLHLQVWFQSKGITSYAIEYRGYGNRSGWPSEKGFYRDGEAALELLLQRENIHSKDVIVFGNSIGCGPASYVAQRYQVGTLVLLAPYTSLVDVVKEMPVFGNLSYFLWYRFPTIEYIARLHSTCVISAHGKRDTTIPFHHSEELRDAYRGEGTFTLIAPERAGHNDLFVNASGDIAIALENCLSR